VQELQWSGHCKRGTLPNAPKPINQSIIVLRLVLAPFQHLVYSLCGAGLLNRQVQDRDQPNLEVGALQLEHGGGSRIRSGSANGGGRNGGNPTHLTRSRLCLPKPHIQLPPPHPGALCTPARRVHSAEHAPPWTCPSTRRPCAPAGPTGQQRPLRSPPRCSAHRPRPALAGLQGGRRRPPLEVTGHWPCEASGAARTRGRALGRGPGRGQKWGMEEERRAGLVPPAWELEQGREQEREERERK
jgi:hypothetical protein